MKNLRGALGLCVILAALTMLVGCQGISSAKNQNQPPFQPPPPTSGGLALSSSSLSFGNVVVTASKTLTVTATNKDADKVTLSTASSTANQFVLNSPALPLAIAAGQSATLSITFTPTATGNITGNLSLASDASNGNLTLPLSGDGVTPGQLALNPTSMNLGEVAVGSGQSQSATLSNVGGGTVDVSEALVTGAGFSVVGITLPLTLAPGAGTNFNVIFAPSSAGAVSGNIRFTSDAQASTLNLPLSGTGSSTVSSGPFGQPIPAEYFGLDLHPEVLDGRVPWPSIPYGVIRLWDTGTTWNDLNPSNGVYDWSQLDSWLTLAPQNGKTDILYTFGVVPPWASSNPSDQSCVTTARPAGSCDPPLDLNADGSGTDLLWQNFVTAIATHAAGKIHYWELWNEPDILSEWNGTPAQMVRMAKDAYNIIKSIDPTAQVTTPSAVNSGLGQNIKSWMPPFLAAGGGNYADIVAFHGYVGGQNPPEAEASIVDTVHSTLSGTLASKPLWDTEGSWGPNSNLTEPDLQVALVARVYLVQWSSGVARFYWYQYGNTGVGTIWDGGLNAAGVAYGQVNDWMVGATLVGPCSFAGTIWTCDFTKPGGIQEEAVWDTAQSCQNGTCTSSSYAPNSVYTSYKDLTGKVTAITSGATVQIGAKPILLTNE